MVLFIYHGSNGSGTTPAIKYPELYAVLWLISRSTGIFISILKIKRAIFLFPKTDAARWHL